MADPADEGSCATVYAGEPPIGGWHYDVRCRVSGRQVHGWKKERDEAVAEARFWIAHFGCEGRCKVC